MKTKFLYLSLLSMLFVLISTTSVSAQDYNIFAKQKIVIADVRDKSDRPLNDGMHQQIRQQVINACVNSDKYEVSEVNMNDVKKNITSKGLQPTPTNLCEEVGRLSKADYIVFLEVNVSANAQNIFLTGALYRIATATVMGAYQVTAAATSSSIISKTSEIARNLLGVGDYSYSTTTDYASPTQAQRKQVGDITTINGVRAIVFQVDNSGQHGMAMSLEETRYYWDDARNWCSNLGLGWRLPSVEELREIYRNREQLNKVLSQSGYEEVQGCHWSSDEDGDEEYRSYAWYLCMYEGDTTCTRKDNYHCVRAVSAF